jgi:hypothetical protein
VDDSAGQSFRRRRRIAAAHPDEGEQAGSHLADGLTIHGDLRRANPLNYRTHLHTYRES